MNDTLAQAATSELFSFQPAEFAPLSNTPGLQVTSNDFIVADPKNLERMQRAIEAVGEVTYHWNIENDEINWSPNAARILQCGVAEIASGRGFAAFLDAENFTSRFDTVMRTQNTDMGAGVAFQIEYLFRPEGKQGKSAVWLEDHGKWFANKHGRPQDVYGTIRKIDDRHSRDQHLSFLGNCDPLTGMMNRGRMAEALGESISVALREQTHSAFLIAAVNNLSVVNEAYGFEVSDEVIVAMGRRLRQVVRSGDGIARYSGSKFGIILNACSEEELQIAIERFLSVGRESVIETQHGPVWAMLSIGALCIPANARDANTAMARAEEALSEARRQPADGYMIYRPSAARTAERSLNARCATEIVTCLKEDRFKLAFQPIIDAKTNTTFMHEALLRMSDENQEIIAAVHLIPIAEKLGLVRLIDRAVLQMTIATLYSHPEARLAINVSGTTATDPRWYTQITELITENSSIAERLTVEITETVALHDLQSTKYFVEKLRNVGCSVAIDDFGAGFTSFRNIRELPINILKLDGSFCANLRANPENQYFVKASIEMGHRFGMKTVAEWVESQDDADTLKSWNIDYLQGNFLGEPSLTKPWQQTADVLFNLQEKPSPEIFVPEFYTSENIAHEEPLELVAEKSKVTPVQAVTEEIVMVDAPVIVDAPAAEDASELTVHFEPSSASETIAEEQPLTLEKPGVDANPMESVETDLSRLWAALDILNEQFSTPKSETETTLLRQAG